MDRDNFAINAIGCLMQSRSSCSSTYQQAHCKIMAMRPFDWFAWLPKRLLHKTGLHNPVHQWYRPVSSLIYRNARCSLLAKVNDERDATKKKIATTTDWTLDAVGECVCALAESTRNGLASTGALSTNRLELTSFEDCVTVWSAQNRTECTIEREDQFRMDIQSGIRGQDIFIIIDYRIDCASLTHLSCLPRIVHVITQSHPNATFIVRCEIVSTGYQCVGRLCLQANMRTNQFDGSLIIGFYWDKCRYPNTIFFETD